MVSSSLCLSAAKLGVGVFGKDDIGKSKGDDPGSTSVDKKIRANHPGTGTNTDKGADDPGTAIDNPGIVAENSGTITDNPGTRIDADVGADNSGTAVDNPGTGRDIDVGADNPGIAASNKARACATSLFALSCAIFLLTSYFELVTAFLSSSSPSSSLTTSRLKLVLSCLVILVKQGAPSSRYSVDKIWRPSLSKVSSGISAVVRFS